MFIRSEETKKIERVSKYIEYFYMESFLKDSSIPDGAKNRMLENLDIYTDNNVRKFNENVSLEAKLPTKTMLDVFAESLKNQILIDVAFKDGCKLSTCFAPVGLLTSDEMVKYCLDEIGIHNISTAKNFCLVNVIGDGEGGISIDAEKIFSNQYPSEYGSYANYCKNKQVDSLEDIYGKYFNDKTFEDRYKDGLLNSNSDKCEYNNYGIELN